MQDKGEIIFKENDSICQSHRNKITSINYKISPMEKVGISLFPNPANEVLNIQCSRALNNLKVYDSTGHKVMDVKSTAQINVSQLPSSLYLLEATFEGGDRLMKTFEKR